MPRLSQKSTDALNEMSERVTRGGLGTTPVHVLIAVMEMYEDRITDLENAVGTMQTALADTLAAIDARLNAFRAELDKRQARTKRRAKTSGGRGAPSSFRITRTKTRGPVPMDHNEYHEGKRRMHSVHEEKLELKRQLRRLVAKYARKGAGNRGRDAGPIRPAVARSGVASRLKLTAKQLRGIKDGMPRQQRVALARLRDYRADRSGRTATHMLSLLDSEVPKKSSLQIIAAAAPREPKETAVKPYKNLADWLTGVRAQTVHAISDPRVRAAAPGAAGNEAGGGDGGYLVPAELAGAVMQAVRANSLAGRCASVTSRTNAPFVPIDGEAPWAASNVYWENELAQLQQRKQVFQGRQLKLKKITVLMPASDELVEDAPAFESWARLSVPQKIAAKLTTGIVRGTGVGQVPDILNADCTIGVARGMSVTATAAAMWKRLISRSTQACWRQSTKKPNGRV
ncbi:MAG: phage major capsid protein [Hyphomicrobiaceae bacterium]